MLRILLIFCLLGLSLPFTGEAKPKEPTKSEKAQAAELFNKAESAYKLQQYEEALKTFQEVYQLLGDPSLLFNIGQCYRQLNQLEEAKKSYLSYLRDAPKSEMATRAKERIQDIDAEIARRALKGAAAVSTEQDPTEIFFDGVAKGSTPLNLADLDPGEHKVLIKKSGYNDLEVVITIKPGETYELKVPTLTKEVNAKVIQIAQEQNRHRIFFIGAAGLSGLGFLSTTGSSVFLRSASQQQQDGIVESEAGDNVISREEILAEQSQLDQKRSFGNAFGISAISFVSAAVISASIGVILKKRTSKESTNQTETPNEK